MKTWLNTREKKMKLADPVNVNRAKASVMYRQWFATIWRTEMVYSQDCALKVQYTIRAKNNRNTLQKSISVFFKITEYLYTMTWSGWRLHSRKLKSKVWRNTIKKYLKKLWWVPSPATIATWKIDQKGAKWSMQIFVFTKFYPLIVNQNPSLAQMIEQPPRKGPGFYPWTRRNYLTALFLRNRHGFPL